MCLPSRTLSGLSARLIGHHPWTLPVNWFEFHLDAPFLAPIKGEMNDPINVVQSCAAIAEARGEAVPVVARQILDNFDACVSRGAQFMQD